MYFDRLECRGRTREGGKTSEYAAAASTWMQATARRRTRRMVSDTRSRRSSYLATTRLTAPARQHDQHMSARLQLSSVTLGKTSLDPRPRRGILPTHTRTQSHANGAQRTCQRAHFCPMHSGGRARISHTSDPARLSPPSTRCPHARRPWPISLSHQLEACARVCPLPGSRHIVLLVKLVPEDVPAKLSGESFSALSVWTRRHEALAFRPGAGESSRQLKSAARYLSRFAPTSQTRPAGLIVRFGRASDTP